MAKFNDEEVVFFTHVFGVFGSVITIWLNWPNFELRELGLLGVVLYEYAASPGARQLTILVHLLSPFRIVNIYRRTIQVDPQPAAVLFSKLDHLFDIQVNSRAHLIRGQIPIPDLKLNL